MMNEERSFQIGDICEMFDGRIGFVTGYVSDDLDIWITPLDESKEIKFKWGDVSGHWRTVHYK